MVKKNNKEVKDLKDIAEGCKEIDVAYLKDTIDYLMRIAESDKILFSLIVHANLLYETLDRQTFAKYKKTFVQGRLTVTFEYN